MWLIPHCVCLWMAIDMLVILSVVVALDNLVSFEGHVIVTQI